VERGNTEYSETLPCTKRNRIEGKVVEKRSRKGNLRHPAGSKMDGRRDLQGWETYKSGLLHRRSGNLCLVYSSSLQSLVAIRDCFAVDKTHALLLFLVSVLFTGVTIP
jgi:hypothetical protein